MVDIGVICNNLIALGKATDIVKQTENSKAFKTYIKIFLKLCEISKYKNNISTTERQLFQNEINKLSSDFETLIQEELNIKVKVQITLK